MKGSKLLVISLLCSMALSLAGCGGGTKDAAPLVPSKPEEANMTGGLGIRLRQNLRRLEEEKYQPGNIFLTEEQSGGWPGDTEGRTILGLVCDARATGETPQYLDEIISLIPGHLNEKGYMGPDRGDVLDEQQLSGNGWMLRGLCAYYNWTGDAKALEWIRSISGNLFVRGKGKYSEYPIDPALRNIPQEGKESGNIAQQSGSWLLSTDIGCVFIGLDGLIDAYSLVGTPEMKEVIDEMVLRFLETDLVGIKAQTHASLTACRALVRYAETIAEETPDGRRLIDEAEKRWALYKRYGMTENYENYNWFTRYDSWTEPCAVVDSYMLAVQLWQHTRNQEYLSDAQLIWYNGLCHTQRFNGGFGCDSCPGTASGNELKVLTDEAHWCCTMRGAEGLSAAAAYSCFRSGDTFYLTCFQDAIYDFDDLTFEVRTNYPGEGTVFIRIVSVKPGSSPRLKLYMPDWIIPTGQEHNNTPAKVFTVEHDGFIQIDPPLKKDDSFTLDYTLELHQEGTLNPDNTAPGQHRYFKGPLILGPDGKPIYHLMDPKVDKASGYSRTILFD